MSDIVVIPVLHNVVSAQKVVEAAKIVYGLGFKTFIISKASGSAAQSGVPEAQKIALKLGLNLVFLSDLEDVIDVVNPDIVLTVMPKKYGGEALTKVWESTVGGAKRVLVIFGGSEPGLSMREMKMGKLVYPDDIEEDIGAIGLVAISLYLIKRFI